MKLAPTVVFMKTKPVLGLPPRLAGFFNRVENTQVVHFVVVANVSHPLVDVVRKSDACHPAFVRGVSFLIEGVQEFWNVSKVFPSVVRSVAIDVVNLPFRHLPGHKEKPQAMRFVNFGFDADYDVAINGNASGFPAFVFGVPHSGFHLGSHVFLAGAKHIWGRGFVKKLTRIRDVCNPSGQVRLIRHLEALYNYFMPKYIDSAANINRRAA
jgi:hypothetical protein